MSKNTGTESNTTKAAALSKGLLRSHLYVAGVGGLLMLVGLLGTLWLRESALQIVEKSGPRSNAVHTIQAGLYRAQSNLRGWIALGDEHQIKVRRNAWDNDVYPAVNKLKDLSATRSPAVLDNLMQLEHQLSELELWQWYVESVAQTQGNYPAMIILEQNIRPVAEEIIAAVTAMIEMELGSDKHEVRLIVLQNMVEIRTKFFRSLQYLESYLSDGKMHDKSEYERFEEKFQEAISKLFYVKGLLESSQTEQLEILARAVKAYSVFSQEALIIRDSNQWSLANYWLATRAVPMAKKIIILLDDIAENEQRSMHEDSRDVTRIGILIPWSMAALLLLMLSVASWLARRGAKSFTKPVIELERQDNLKSDLSEFNRLLSGDYSVSEISQKAVGHLCNKIGAIAGASYIADSSQLLFSAGYGVPDNIPQLVKIDEGLLGQAYVNQEAIEITDGRSASFRIQSGFVDTDPNYSTITPAVVDDVVVAVLEFVSIDAISKENRGFLESALRIFGVAVRSERQKELVEDALQESEAQTLAAASMNERLLEQQVAMKHQQEELTATNEELFQQSDLMEQQTVELKIAHDEAEAKAEALEEANRYKSEFLANMSHELRTPLNSLLILSRSLAENDEGNLSDEDVESVEIIQESGTHLLDLINDILDLSKVEAGRMTLSSEEVSFESLSDSMRGRFNHMATDKGISFIVELNDQLPESFVADGSKLGQILTNLIGNSIKFTQKGEVKLSISQEDNKTLAFAVSDTGMGIAEDQQAAIFEAFQQADGSTTRVHGGTGLGLSIALRFAELMSGGIRLKSVLGEGSTFLLTLPLEVSQVERTSAKATHKEVEEILDAVPVVASSQPAKPIKASSTEQSPIVLMVEDDQTSFKVMSKLIQTEGMRIEHASTASEAKNMLAEKQYQGMILDMGLPDMDGFQLLESCDALNMPLPPVIVYSGFDFSDEDQARLAPFTDRIVVKSKESGARLVDELQATIFSASNRNKIAGVTNATSDNESADNKKLEGKTVLLVDDDMRNTFALAKVLRKRGLIVHIAPSGNKALEILSGEDAADIVLMDIMMPGMDGLETTQCIRELDTYKSIPIIAVTANAMQGDKENCLQAGASDYLSKPVDIDNLILMMSKWL